MTLYTVYVQETVVLVTEVSASSEEKAREVAIRAVIEGQAEVYAVVDRTVTEVVGE